MVVCHSGFCGTQWDVGKGASIESAFEMLNREISVYDVSEHVCEELSPCSLFMGL